MATEPRPLRVAAPPEEDTGTLEFLDFEEAPPCEWAPGCGCEADLYVTASCPKGCPVPVSALCDGHVTWIVSHVARGGSIGCAACGRVITGSFRILGPVKG